MAEYIVEIGDENGKSFKMLIDSSGFWRTLNKGFIRFNSGSCSGWEWYGEFYCYSMGTPEWERKKEILTLEAWKFSNDWSPRKSGEGYVEQAAVLTLDPGKVSWVITETRGWF